LNLKKFPIKVHKGTFSFVSIEKKLQSQLFEQ